MRPPATPRRLALLPCLLLLIGPAAGAQTTTPASVGAEAALPVGVDARSAPPALETLRVGLWPDYDRAATLVMLTGTLDGFTRLPASVAVPLPAGAELHAVARVDDAGRMISDLRYDVEGGTLTLEARERVFRVEYYVPYRVVGDEREIEFGWKSDLSVGRLEVTVQQPAAAPHLWTEPAAAEEGTGTDGLLYHRLPVRSVPHGERYTVRARYPMPAPRLSKAPPASATPPAPAAGGAAPAAAPPRAAAAPAVPEAGFDWAMALALLAVGLASSALTWQVARWRFASSAAGAAAAARTGSEPAASPACPACGKALAAADRFCSGCGAKRPGA